jgi:hypothetical protein
MELIPKCSTSQNRMTARTSLFSLSHITIKGTKNTYDERTSFILTHVHLVHAAENVKSIKIIE